MATEEACTIIKVGDKYRSFLHEDTENTTQWRHGGPPNFDTVNQLFEEGRTKVLNLLYTLSAYALCYFFFFFFICIFLLPLNVLVSFSVFDIWFEGMAKRIARRSSAKCYKDMGYGNRTQDSRTGH